MLYPGSIDIGILLGKLFKIENETFKYIDAYCYLDVLLTVRPGKIYSV